MERLLRAQRLAASDIEKGVTIDMIIQHQQEHARRKDKGLVPSSFAIENQQSWVENYAERIVHETSDSILNQIATDLVKAQTVRKLLNAILETEVQEERLRNKYVNLLG